MVVEGDGKGGHQRGKACRRENEESSPFRLTLLVQEPRQEPQVKCKGKGVERQQNHAHDVPARVDNRPAVELLEQPVFAGRQGCQKGRLAGIEVVCVGPQDLVDGLPAVLGDDTGILVMIRAAARFAMADRVRMLIHEAADGIPARTIIIAETEHRHGTRGRPFAAWIFFRCLRFVAIA